MIEQALSHIDPTDREVWVKMGMAIFSELGKDGFEIWDAWSQRADNYKPGSAKSVWRSFKPRGGVSIGSLYYEARQAGWKGEIEPGRQSVLPKPKTTPNTAVRAHVRAAEQAQDMLSRARYAPHTYLTQKGFPESNGLVLDNLLLIPIRELKTNRLLSLQTIDDEGRKRFLKGGKVGGGVFPLGRGFETYLCEGYATGLSIKAALENAYRQARVVVCFSAGNIPRVADQIRIKSNAYVVADNDPISNAGRNAAEKSGLKWWMPPEPGDANDFEQDRGVRELAQALADLRMRA